MNKTPISIALERQIPEHIREEYATFVQFVKAYYEFLEQTQERNLENYRSLDYTLDEFIFKFKKELAALFQTTGLEDERFLLQRIREFYKSRGSEESFKFLFRTFFNKEAEIYYPSKQVLRASSGQWIQEKSIFVKAATGKSLFDLNGKIITIITSRKHINVYSPRVRLYRDGIYEVFIDRAYISDISIGEEVQLNEVSYGTILPCPAKYTIVKKGSGFSVGSIYSLPSANGEGSVVKITKVNSNGGIEKVQIISFGLDYQTTFFAKLSNSYYKPLDYFHPLSAATIGGSHPSGLWPTSSFTRSEGFYGDTTTGYIDYGYVIKNDYFAYQADYNGAGLPNTADPDPYFGFGDYVGEIIGEFYTNALNGAIIDDSVAEIMIDLGPVAVYPGYYNSTDGFISDEIYIQDGKYYQSFSYVIKVEQQLDTYVDMIKSLLHPAGYELFAQYNIKNDFIVSTVPLDAFVRYQFFDRAFVADFSPLPVGGTLNVGQLKQDNVPTIDAFAPEGSPTNIKRYSQLYSVAIDGTVTLTNSTSSGPDGYFSDYGLAAQITRHQNQTDTLKNNWDIVLGNQNSTLGTVSPLTADTTSVIGNFENRSIGSSDTLGFGKSAADTSSTQDSFAPSGSPTNIKKYSSLLNVASDGTYTIGTPTGITSALNDYPTTTESYVGGAFGSVNGLEWNLWATSGPTHNQTVTAISYYNSGWDYEFKDRTLKFYSELLNVAVDGTYTIGTATGNDAVFSNYTSSVDYFDRTNASSSTITYNRSTVPLEETNALAIDSSFRGPDKLITDLQSSGDAFDYRFFRFMQPTLLGFTATIVAGSKEIVLTSGIVTNTMIGSILTVVSGTGALGVGSIVDTVDTVNNKLLMSVNHITSGAITFTASASSSESGVLDLAGTATAVTSSGIGWEFAGATFNKTATANDVLTSTITFDRTTTPLEQTSVTATHGGMNWSLWETSGPTHGASNLQIATTSDGINLKASDKNVTSNDDYASAITDNRMNWDLTLYATSYYVNYGIAVESISLREFTKVFKEEGYGVNPGINTLNTGTLYYNPYNIETDTIYVNSYNQSDYFVSDTRAL